MDPTNSGADRAHILKSISRSARVLEVPVYFHRSVDELLPQCGPSVVVALRSNHSANVVGLLDNCNFEKPLTVGRHPVQQFVVTIAATLYPTALSMIEVEPGPPRRPGTRRPSKTKTRPPPKNHQHGHTERVEESLEWQGFLG